MKRTPEQSARVAAWLNILDHCEAQLQRMGAFVHEVRTAPMNARGEWIPERECVVVVSE